MSDSKPKNMETPADYGCHGGPGDAKSLPTKHYGDSQVKPGKMSVDSPAQKGPVHK